MSWPAVYPFGNAVSPEAMANLDIMFNAAAALTSLPCSAAGTNTISLTPLVNVPTLSAYVELSGYRFTAVGNSSGPVSLQYNGLGFLPVYLGDGVTQASTGNLLSGQQYIGTFHQALNGGSGGFYLESPSLQVVTAGATLWNQPGGRLTFSSGVPVMFSTLTAQQTVYYAPYQHPFVPIYNGTLVQMMQFTSSLSDQVGLTFSMAGSASWPSGFPFDVFITLNGGVPVMATVQWTNNTTRATTLSIFGGFLTNSGSVTMRINSTTTITVPANQGTFVGTFYTSANGQSQWVFPASASGGTAGYFGLCNYYNPVLHTGFVTDSGASYVYSSATIRQARASAGNQITILQTSSERAVHCWYFTHMTINNAGVQQVAGIGVNSTTSFSDAVLFANQQATNNISDVREASITLSATGLFVLSANEQGEAGPSDTFNAGANNHFGFMAWL